MLVPNTELGHIEIDGKDAETIAADSVRERKELSWKKYAARVEKYLRRLDALLWPDLIILGGGASKKADKLLPHLDVRPGGRPGRTAERSRHRRCRDRRVGGGGVAR